MPSSPSIDNTQRGIRLNRELDAKVLRKFRFDKTMTVRDAYILALQFATRDVELTVEDILKIADDKRKAASKKVKGGK